MASVMGIDMQVALDSVAGAAKGFHEDNRCCHVPR